MNREWNNKLLLVDLSFLRLFDKPVVVSELCERTKRSNSTIRSRVTKLHNLGLIQLAYYGTNSRGHDKKYFVLFSKGDKLLDLFPGEQKVLRNNKFLAVNLELLRLFKEPFSISELVNSGCYRNYGGIHRQVTKLCKMELIQLKKTSMRRMGAGSKKFYVLSPKGKKLLDIFPENLEDAEEVD